MLLAIIARSLLVGDSPPLWLLPFLHVTFLGIALPFVLVVIALNILQAVSPRDTIGSKYGSTVTVKHN